MHRSCLSAIGSLTTGTNSHNVGASRTIVLVANIRVIHTNVAPFGTTNGRERTSVTQSSESRIKACVSLNQRRLIVAIGWEIRLPCKSNSLVCCLCRAIIHPTSVFQQRYVTTHFPICSCTPTQTRVVGNYWKSRFGYAYSEFGSSSSKGGKDSLQLTKAHNHSMEPSTLRYLVSHRAGLSVLLIAAVVITRPRSFVSRYNFHPL